MTSDYDLLGSIAYSAEKKPEMREFALWVLREAKREVEATVPPEEVAKISVPSFYTDELDILTSFLSDSHSRIDHTSKYHLKTFSANFRELLDALRTVLMFIERNSHDIYFMRKKVATRYPQLVEFVKKNGFHQTRSSSRGIMVWEHKPKP